MMLYTRNQFVPIVCKNRDYLIGFLDCASNISFDGDLENDMVLTLSSLRFTDYLPDGSRKRHHDKETITQILTDYRESMRIHESVDDEMSEDSDSVIPPLLKLHCSCGNYIEFATELDIPKHSHRCDLCSKYLIDYTFRDTYEFVYDGDLDDELGEDEDE